MTFEKLPAVEGSVACLTCGCGARSDLDMDRMIAVGFGAAGVRKDDVPIFDESSGPDDEEPPIVAEIEAQAMADPDHDWRIFFHAPLYDAEYQRQAEGVWVLVRKGEGFA